MNDMFRHFQPRMPKPYPPPKHEPSSSPSDDDEALISPDGTEIPYMKPLRGCAKR